MVAPFSEFKPNLFFVFHLLFIPGHFYFGKYIDSVMRSRATAIAIRFPENRLLGSDEDLMRARIIGLDKTCQKFILMAMNHYAIALKLDTKHVYQALPRLLSLWFEFTSIGKEHTSVDASNQDANYSGE